MITPPRGEGAVAEQADDDDVSRRLAELRAVRAVLEPDAADPAVASELDAINRQITATEGLCDR